MGGLPENRGAGGPHGRSAPSHLINVVAGGAISPTIGAGGGLFGCGVLLFLTDFLSLTDAASSGRTIMTGCAVAGSVAATAGMLASVNPDSDLRQQLGAAVGAAGGFWTAYALVGLPEGESGDESVTARGVGVMVVYLGLSGAGAWAGDRLGTPRRYRLSPSAGPAGTVGLRLDARF